MNNLFWKVAPVLGALMVVLAGGGATANPLKTPAPDPGLLAAVDVQAHVLAEGVVTGDFEAWYPGVYFAYAWAREIRELSAGGLFQVDYTIFEDRPHAPKPVDQLSLLLSRPESPPGSASGGIAAWTPAQGWTGARPVQPAARMMESSRAAGVIEDALVAAQLFTANASFYLLVGDSQGLSLVSRLPASFPGAESFGGGAVRRVSFCLEGGRKGGSDLVVEHAPLLVDTGQVAPYRTRLVEGVSVFHLQYWDAQGGDWTEQWDSSNSLPGMVQVTLGLGEPRGRAGVPHELVSRIVALPATPVAGDIQGIQPPGPPTPRVPPLFPTNSRPGSPGNPQPSQVAALVPKTAASAMAAGHLSTELGRQARRATPPKAPISQSKHNGAHDLELEWLGRSGVELARHVLAMESTGPNGAVDCLNQRWAGGPGDPASPVATLPLEDFVLGNGSFSIRIVDWDRKFNVNLADEIILSEALSLAGVEVDQVPAIVDAILDWRDPDDTPRPRGAESDTYQSGWPPYWAKNGPMDDLAELLRIQGMTPEIYWGSADGGVVVEPASQIGLAELFTTLSSGRMNVNTASATQLQVLPLIDQNVAHAIILARAGPDGVDGTADDIPFRNPADLGRVPGLDPTIVQQLGRYLTTRSLVFEVTVEARMGREQGTYVGVLRRNATQDIQLLYFYQE